MDHTHFVVTVCAVFLAFEDRLIGWGGWGRTKPVILGILGLLGMGYWMGLSLPGVFAFPVAFLVWRTPGWTFMGGSINPSPAKAIFTFFRQSLAFAFLVPAYLSHLDMAPVAECLLGFTVIATLLGVINFFTLAKMNWLVETVRGGVLGAALGLGYMLLNP